MLRATNALSSPAASSFTCSATASRTRVMEALDSHSFPSGKMPTKDTLNVRDGKCGGENPTHATHFTINTPLMRERFNSCKCPIRRRTAPLLTPRRLCHTLRPELRARPRLWLGFALPKPAPLSIDRTLQPAQGSLCLGVQLP